jgi:hypothetical protein
MARANPGISLARGTRPYLILINKNNDEWRFDNQQRRWANLRILFVDSSQRDIHQKIANWFWWSERILLLSLLR